MLRGSILVHNPKLETKKTVKNTLAKKFQYIPKIQTRQNQWNEILIIAQTSGHGFLETTLQPLCNDPAVEGFGSHQYLATFLVDLSHFQGQTPKTSSWNPQNNTIFHKKKRTWPPKPQKPCSFGISCWEQWILTDRQNARKCSNARLSFSCWELLSAWPKEIALKQTIP